jgi:Mce-associated membrane protein
MQDIAVTHTDAEVDAEGRTSESSTDSSPAVPRSVAVKPLALGLVVALLVIGLAVVTWQLRSTSDELSSIHSAEAGRAQAEQIALDYATGAAEMDFRDLPTWRTRLTQGTSSELSNRLTQASSSMEQIISPLQWTSTAQPISAKAVAGDGGIYSVDCFISVMTTNSQAPEGIMSTATYKLTIDSGDDWKITEISGIDSALAGDAAPR